MSQSYNCQGLKSEKKKRNGLTRKISVLLWTLPNFTSVKSELLLNGLTSKKMVCSFGYSHRQEVVGFMIPIRVRDIVVMLFENVMEEKN